jgi:uncharacterized protein DUF4369
MKKLLLAAMASLPAIAFAQDGKYTVQGTVGSYNAPAKIYLQYQNKDKVVTDSVELKNGKFSFTGNIGDEPKGAYLVLNANGTGPVYKDYKSLYIEKGVISVSSADSVYKAKIEGTKTNLEMPGMTRS